MPVQDECHRRRVALPEHRLAASERLEAGAAEKGSSGSWPALWEGFVEQRSESRDSGRVIVGQRVFAPEREVGMHRACVFYVELD
jgi:hypothetical protein